MPKGQPNVLLITTDQHRGDCMGYGVRGVKTPHIDRLAETGTRFNTCITPNPMCQPARAAILTGKLPYSNGVRDNGRNLDEALGQDGMGGVFSRAGYQTHFIGKAHFSSNETFDATGRPECYTSTADFPADWCGPYFGFQHVELTLRPHHHCAWNDPPYTLHFENFLNGDGLGRARWQRAKEQAPPATDHPQAWRTPLGDRWQSTTWIGDRAVDLIESKGEKPIFSWISFPDPHPPFLASEPWSQMYDPQDVVIAESRSRDLEGRPWWHSAFLKHRLAGDVERENAEGGKNWSDMGRLDEAELRQITAIYFGMISAVDHQVGRIVKALEDTGALENTIIVFASDHGEWLGDHGLLLKGPMLYDGLLRVPLVIAGPGVPRGRVIDDPVSTLDLRSTLAELAAIDATADNGCSLVPVMTGAERRDFALSEWEVDAERSGVSLDLRTVRTRRHRMSVDLSTGAGELYDFDTDPSETTNLWSDASHRPLRDELMDMIHSRPDDMIPAAPRVGWH
ncbi:MULTISPECIES: sulfatase [unclassified Ruegeria]|uniref:sulfatase family protein n=1 Tax=unclassified Ruegeria TaxID=2625375 RepID=UPI001487DC84|nr:MULTISPECIES: sulfatase-like hydrolase/transferase [unclassified Ruegeria]